MAVTHLSAKPPCQICWVRNLCAGGWPAKATSSTGPPGHATTHRCRWIRAWTNMGLHAYMEIMERNPAFLEQIEKGQE